MGVFLRKSKSGELLPYFQGSYTLNGKRVNGIRLNAWKGTPPTSGNASDWKSGDILFQQSYLEAENKLKHIKDTLAESPTETKKARLIEEYNEIQKQLLESDHVTPLTSLWDDYKEKVGSFSCTPSTVKAYETYTKRFADFVSKRHQEGLSLPLFSVTFEDIQDFLQSLIAEGNKNRTWNEYLRLIKRLFRVLYPEIEVSKKLSNIKTKPENNTQHKVFTVEEVEKIWAITNELSKKDSSFSLIHSMVVIAGCTGLRLKDIRLLKWSNINFNRKIISLVTHKNKAPVTLGIWSPLEEELLKLQHTSDKSSEYVLPEAVTRSSTYLNKQLKRVLALAGLITTPESLSISRVTESPQDLFSTVSEAVNHSTMTPKRKQLSIKILSEYILNGLSVDGVAQTLGISKGNVSNYLNEATRLSSKQIIRNRVNLSDTMEKKELTDITETTDEIIGWHCFRGSFVTMAIKKGISIDLLKKILGSSIVDIIYKHYLHPDDEFIQEGFTDKDPFKH